MRTVVGMLLGLAVAAVTAGCEKEKEAEVEADKPAEAVAEVDKKLARLNPNDGDKLPFETAKIVFDYKGLEVGTVTAWIADSGQTVILEKDMTKPMPDKATTIWKDGKTTMWNTERKLVQIMRIRPRDTELRLVSTNDPKQFEMAGYQKKPNESVAGKDCEVWFHPGTNVTLWRWNGIDLKYMNGSLKKVTQSVEATSVETGVTLPADLTAYPDGYDVSDMTK